MEKWQGDIYARRNERTRHGGHGLSYTFDKLQRMKAKMINPLPCGSRRRHRTERVKGNPAKSAGKENR
jgi:hypothetical protein